MGPAEQQALCEIIAEDRHATVRQITARLAERTGVKVHPLTLGKIIKRLGIRRVHQTRHLPGPAAGSRYGYTERHRNAPTHARYASSVTDAEWAEVCDLFDPPGRGGRPPRHDRRAMLDACLYVVRTGCAWRMLPTDFPYWDNVYKTFRRWQSARLFEQMHDRLLVYWRAQMDRQASPTRAVIDSQSSRHSPQGGEAGFDANKKIKGRKRHMVTDTLGLVLAVSVSAACVSDRNALASTMDAALAKHPQITSLYADGGYAGQIADAWSSAHAVVVSITPSTARAWTGPQAELFGAPPTPPGGGLYKRWVVERTHAWQERFRRLIMHHDRLPEIGEAWVWLANARLLLNRLFR
ncbi:transposase IS4 [Salinisphaera orenii MK-B5]|uniref:Transposase IS4 n=1 Tax=Salinisphaera orenii MK-B5 TaxID=856730 RepID=A0A423PY28_9GAMM|nr:transposase IS4 [Salinisphaera orenii MK-B5]